MEEELRARIEALTQERERFMAMANDRVSMLAGGIAELTRLLEIVQKQNVAAPASGEPDVATAIIAEGVD